MRSRRFLTVLLLLALAGGAAFWLITEPATLPATAFADRKADLANGEAMFNVGGCASCHRTSGLKEGRQLGGGQVFKTPFGSFKAPNISAHPSAGIGNWSEREFANAMLKGVGRRGEHLYPAFPYTSYQRMRLDDIRDLYAFMKTLPQDARANEPHDLSFPFNVRRGLGVWKWLYADGRSFSPDPAKSAEINRGAYLVNGPGHCAECHSPRHAIGGIDESRRFAGGHDPEGKSWVPNITPHSDGIASWSDKDIAYLLETGMNPEADSVGSTMAEVVENTAKLNDADRKAMAAYLKSLPPRPGRAPK